MTEVTLNQLKRLDDMLVVVVFPGLQMNALVSYNPEEYSENEDGTLYLTNSRGGRNTYEEVISQGGKVYLPC